MKHIYVMAANYRHFSYWCHSNGIFNFNEHVTYVARPETLWGVIGEESQFIFYETWRQHPQAAAIYTEYQIAMNRPKYVPVYVRSKTVEPTPIPNNSFWYKLTKLEPAVYRGLIISIVALLASVGVAISPGVPDALIGFILVVVPIVQALWTRPAVTANARVSVYLPDPQNEPDYVRAGEAVTTATNAEIVEAAKEEPRG